MPSPLTVTGRKLSSAARSVSGALRTSVPPGLSLDSTSYFCGEGEREGEWEREGNVKAVRDCSSQRKQHIGLLVLNPSSSLPACMYEA